MKSTGIIRRVDDLGRLVIPRELRKKHFIEEGTAMEFFSDGDSIVLRKYSPEEHMGTALNMVLEEIDEQLSDTYVSIEKKDALREIRKSLKESLKMLKNINI